MIFVQKQLVLLCHLRRIDRITLKRCQRQRLKAEELSKFILLLLHAEEQILQTDTKLPLQINSRFIRGDHARLQLNIAVRLSHDPVTDRIRSLMNV